MTARHTVKFTANFERNLEEVEAFLREAGVPQAFEVLVGELTNTIIPNLERFSSMGWPFLKHSVRSVETSNGVARLTEQLNAVADGSELREYMMASYLLLYGRIKGTVYLLSIHHYQQLSFDLAKHWPT